MSNLRRSASLDRILAETDFRHKVSADRAKCNLHGYPYCCTGHYYSYRYWPYYLDHRVADHEFPGWCHHRGCQCQYRYYYPSDYELWPRYYSEYLKGYDYGLWKYGKCPPPAPRVVATPGRCVWCPVSKRAVSCRRLGCSHCCRA